MQKIVIILSSFIVILMAAQSSNAQYYYRPSGYYRPTRYYPAPRPAPYCYSCSHYPVEPIRIRRKTLGDTKFEVYGLGNYKGYRRIYNPNFKDFVGETVMPVPNYHSGAVYVGWVSWGYANISGIIQFYDAEDGWVTYKGSFDYGIPDGTGEIINNNGYMKVRFLSGDVIERLDVTRREIDTTTAEINTTTKKIENKVKDDDSEFVKLPSNIKEMVVDDASELGRKYFKSK